MTRSEIEDKLGSKFRFQRDTRRDNHRWWILKLPDLAPIATFFPHSKNEIRHALEGKIARELKVNSSYLRGMVNCTKERETYYAHLRNRSRL